MNAAETAARAGYRTEPRPFAEVARELAEGASNLRAIAGAIRLCGPAAATLTEADSIVTGCGLLIAELRQGAPE